ncbi:MAG: GNAT family N-acetyltransferase [Rhodothermales bacterium]|nr:GNAT family N-acetyltransferase [Rhodothermales bacterium]
MPLAPALSHPDTFVVRPLDRNSESDRASWARMRLILFDDLDPEFNEADMAAFEERHEQEVLLAFADDAGLEARGFSETVGAGASEPTASPQARGFAEVALRNLVDGCLTSPVGYLEAIYVDPAARGHGLGKQLLDAAKDWSREQGCTEFATDSDLKDVDAQQFHLANGFSETYRIVQFRMDL